MNNWLDGQQCPIPGLEDWVWSVEEDDWKRVSCPSEGSLYPHNSNYHWEGGLSGTWVEKAGINRRQLTVSRPSKDWTPKLVDLPKKSPYEGLSSEEVKYRELRDAVLMAYATGESCSPSEYEQIIKIVEG